MTAPAAARTGADDWNRNERDIIEACVRAASVSPDLRAAALAELARLRAAHQTQQEALRDLYSEIDCRVEHGAESGGHLEYVRERLRALAAVSGTEVA